MKKIYRERLGVYIIRVHIYILVRSFYFKYLHLLKFLFKSQCCGFVVRQRQPQRKPQLYNDSKSLCSERFEIYVYKQIDYNPFAHKTISETHKCLSSGFFIPIEIERPLKMIQRLKNFMHYSPNQIFDLIQRP